MEEKLCLQAALPSSVGQQPVIVHGQELILANNDNNDRTNPIQGPESKPSVLHRLTAAGFLQAFILIQFLLPYVKLFLMQAFEYERKHRISERVVRSSIDTVDGFGRKTGDITSAIYSMNNGKVGQAINECAVWWVRGLTGGIHQGIGEGIAVLRAEPAANGRGTEGI